MSHVDIQIRCQRCGTNMDLRDPGPGMPWTPDQFWVCSNCGRHFWTTYPPPAAAKPAGTEAPKAAAAAPATAAAAPKPAAAAAVAAKPAAPATPTPAPAPNPAEPPAS